jgi:tetratricopeptide (TPR) repeat protein
LYVLLSGQNPAGRGPHSAADLLKAIVEDTPRRPSEVAVSKDKIDPGATDRLRRQLRGDLDTIVLKALKKNPEERYGSVGALAGDLRRYLRNEPISARPDTVRYRAAKFVRRHRAALALATFAVVATIAGLVGTILQARTARQQRDTAIRERDRATNVTEFMTNMFKVSDPYGQEGKTITAREILDKAAQQIEAGLAKDPEAQAHMMYVMGEVYDNMGLISQGKALLGRAIEIQRRVLSPNDVQTLASQSQMAVILTEEGHFEEAEKLQRETFDTCTRVLGPENPLTVRSMSRLATVYSVMGRNAEAEKLKRQALVLQTKLFGAEHPDTLVMTNSLVSILWSEGDEKLYPEAEKLQRQALEIERRVFGPDHPDTLNGMMSLGVILRREGQYAEAEKIYRETLLIQSRVLGPNHPDTLSLRDYLATAIAKQGRFQEAEALYRETRSAVIKIYGPNHPSTANSTYNLACIAAVQGHHDEALSLLNDALDHGLSANTALGMESDEDLKSLRGDPRFAALVARTKTLSAHESS